MSYIDTFDYDELSLKAVKAMNALIEMRNYLVWLNSTTPKTPTFSRNQSHRQAKKAYRETMEHISTLCDGIKLLRNMLSPRPIESWHEDDGDVLWWEFPISEPPYVGSPLCSDWPGYHSHWTPLPPSPFQSPLPPLEWEKDR